MLIPSRSEATRVACKKGERVWITREETRKLPGLQPSSASALPLYTHPDTLNYSTTCPLVLPIHSSSLSSSRRTDPHRPRPSFHLPPLPLSSALLVPTLPSPLLTIASTHTPPPSPLTIASDLLADLLLVPLLPLELPPLSRGQTPPPLRLLTTRLPRPLLLRVEACSLT
jgi:hypothetical protein